MPQALQEQHNITKKANEQNSLPFFQQLHSDQKLQSCLDQTPLLKTNKQQFTKNRSIHNRFSHFKESKNQI
ncbi:hypothetical protein CDL12_09611 [Handroanthus impetiginosus]|uniref:Uncharacterized protein n=1 Tax=Handroanthus impetiginosus TaxID=429701 RepID=A0A2G9HKB3_9LAMI|nr:hypothetical protein CDL12_09611 [Handroanthus impetiginosus]